MKVILSLLIAFVILYSLIPKFLLVDMLLTRAGFYILAKEVDEDLLSLRLISPSLYTKDRFVGLFDELRLSLVPVSVELVCRGKTLRAKIYPFGGVHIASNEMKCFQDYNISLIDLRIEDGVWGRLQLQNIDAGGVKLDTLSLNFKGRIFSAEIGAYGQKGVGSGQVQKDKINGQVFILGQTFVISGSLTNLQVVRR